MIGCGSLKVNLQAHRGLAESDKPVERILTVSGFPDESAAYPGPLAIVINGRCPSPLPLAQGGCDSVTDQTRR